MRNYDAIVIGSGINGMVAAAELGKRGWSVALVEKESRIGGFIRSEERTLPGYTHDTFSSWHPLFVTGGAFAELGDDLARHGLRYSNSDGNVTASVGSDGRAVVATRDPQGTANSFETVADRARYVDMINGFGQMADVIGGLLGSELSDRTLAGKAVTTLRRKGRADMQLMIRDAVTSGRGFARRTFDGWEADRLWIPWLLHSGLGPDQASGGIMLPVFAATMHGAGLPIVTGGASGFVSAFEKLLAELGVEVLTDTTVERIVVENGAAVGVITGGEELRASRAVLASVTPQALYGTLLASAPAVPALVREQAKRYRYGRGAMQVHVALSAPMAWSDDRLDSTPLVHVSDGSSSTGIAVAQAEAGLLPTDPTIVVGQQYVLDPSRVPAGAGSLWLQLQELPYSPLGDAAGSGALDTSKGWDNDLKRGYVDRVISRLAQHAPDLESRILAVDIIAPTDIEAANVNAVAGDPYSGAADLDQNLLWRPIPSAAHHKTAVNRLWHIGASTHPGPGLGGGSGHIVASRLGKK